MRRRLDAELVRRKLAPSREAAQRAIAEHRVLVSGTMAEKPARLVDAGEPIEVLGDGPEFVSRGGKKLAGALEAFAIDVSGLPVFDAGASTGGFTDCLLQRGAVSVVAVDVGFGQLHEKLRADPRVEVHERVNLRTVDPGAHFSGRRFPLLVGDLSFISLRSVANTLCALVEQGGAMVLLVKPQFEAGREEVARGRGIVSDPEVWRRCLVEVGDAFELRQAAMIGVMPSPITGTDGNVEFLVHLHAVPASVGGGDSASRSSMIDRAVAEARRAYQPNSPDRVPADDAEATIVEGHSVAPTHASIHPPSDPAEVRS